MAVTTPPLQIVVLGLSITSSWGNGHATTYRGLLRGMSQLGHDVLFLERDLPWYADNRDLPQPDFVRAELYTSVAELKQRFTAAVRDADLVIVGSYVPEGVEIGHWVTQTARGLTAFYDIDTPVTLGMLAAGESQYLDRALVERYAMYLSFTGGPVLDRLERQYGSPAARALYCSADTAIYCHDPHEPAWDLAYMGTYSADRQPALDTLLLRAAAAWPQGRFAVVGPQYPDALVWPANTERIAHLAPDRHSSFYNRQRFTLNITRAQMREVGYSPSIRLFEAAACGTPVISDDWPGLDTLFAPGREILIARSTDDVVSYLQEIPEADRQKLGALARQRVLASHTGKHRAQELLGYVRELT